MCSFGFITASNLLYSLNIPFFPPATFSTKYVLFMFERRRWVSCSNDKNHSSLKCFSHEFIIIFLNMCISCNSSEISKCFTAFLMSRWRLWLLLKHKIMIMSTTSHTNSFIFPSYMNASIAGLYTWHVCITIASYFPWKPTEHRM